MEVRFFRKDERELLLEAIDRIWRKNYIYLKAPEVLDHLMFQNPYREKFAGNDNYSVLGMFDSYGKVKGIFAVIPQRLNAFGREYDASVSGALWAVEEHVNGLKLISKYLSMDIKMFLTLCLLEKSLTVMKAIGFHEIPNLPRWILVNHPEATIQNIASNKELIPFFPLVKRMSIEQEQYHIEYEIDRVAWDDFYRKFFAPMMIGVVRDSSFMEWRYKKAPILSYQFISVVDQQDHCHGLAVIRIESILDGKYKIGRILEFIAVEEVPSLLLANAILEYDKEVLMWDFYCLSSTTVYGLECIGFQRIPEWMDKMMVPTRFQPIDYEYNKINGSIYLSNDIESSIDPISGNKWYVTRGDGNAEMPTVLNL